MKGRQHRKYRGLTIKKSGRLPPHRLYNEIPLELLENTESGGSQHQEEKR